MTTPTQAARYVQLTAITQPSALRMATFRGHDHVVVPVVAAIGGMVVQGLNSPGREMVPANVLDIAPSSWNGRPVVPFHPSGGTDTANTPSLLETSQFGQVFNSKFEDNRLQMEAWLDPQQAEIAGPDALETLAKAQSGDPVEISIGGWVLASKEPGVSNGEAFDYQWQLIIPDHLAVGLQKQGGKGACSNEMGCGGNARWMSGTLADNSTYKIRLCDGAGSCTCGCGDPKSETAQPGTGSEEDEATQSSESTIPVPVTEKGQVMSKVAELAGRLIACSSAGFTDEDRPRLEAFSEEQLGKMVESFEPKPETVVETKKEEVKKEEEKQGDETTVTVSISAAELADLRASANREAKREKEYRGELIATLAKSQKVFSEKVLSAKTTEDLEGLCDLVEVDRPDYSGRGNLARRHAEQPEETNFESFIPPDPWKVFDKSKAS